MNMTEVQFTLQHPHLWHSALSGQVLDPASLNTFWYELTNGVDGTIQRAKGIFDVADGRPLRYLRSSTLYFDFVAELAETTYLELNLPLWLNGRPARFSGIEVVGEGLDQAAIAQTIKECYLNDQAILLPATNQRFKSHPSEISADCWRWQCWTYSRSSYLHALLPQFQPN